MAHLTPAEVNHLRRLLGWVRCEIGMDPEEYRRMMRDTILPMLGPLTEAQKKTIMANYLRFQSVPKYIRKGLERLELAVRAADEVHRREAIEEARRLLGPRP